MNKEAQELYGLGAKKEFEAVLPPITKFENILKAACEVPGKQISYSKVFENSKDPELGAIPEISFDVSFGEVESTPNEALVTQSPRRSSIRLLFIREYLLNRDGFFIFRVYYSISTDFY